MSSTEYSVFTDKRSIAFFELSEKSRGYFAPNLGLKQSSCIKGMRERSGRMASLQYWMDGYVAEGFVKQPWSELIED